MTDEKKRVGRPQLSPEEKEKRRIAKNKRENERQRANGYAAQKKYRAAVRGKIYEPKLTIPINKKEQLFMLLKSTGLTMTQLFVGAVEEKYGIILHEMVDNGKQ